jgi:hypothetical protein
MLRSSTASGGGFKGKQGSGEVLLSRQLWEKGPCCVVCAMRACCFVAPRAVVVCRTGVPFAFCNMCDD